MAHVSTSWVCDLQSVLGARDQLDSGARLRHFMPSRRLYARHDGILDRNGLARGQRKHEDEITPCGRKKTSPSAKRQLKWCLQKLSKTIILLCRSILIQLQCSLAANELHVQGKGRNRVLSQSFNVLNVPRTCAKMQRFPLWHAIPEREVAGKDDWLGNVWLHIPLTGFPESLSCDIPPLKAISPVMGKVQSIIAPRNGANSSLGNVVHFLHSSIFVCACALWILC